MQRKAQTSKMFTFILLAIAVALILVFGVSNIMKIQKQESQTELLLFKSQLEADFASIPRGETQAKSYKVPKGMSEVCFVDWHSYNLPLPGDEQALQSNRLVEDAIISQYNEPGDQRADTFIVLNGAPESIRFGNVKLKDAFMQCYKADAGTIKMLIENDNGFVVVGQV